MKTPEPKRIRLNPEAPTQKSVAQIPMPSICPTDIDLYENELTNSKDDFHIRPDNDSIYRPITKKD
jgi:hypothetical protein